MESASRFVGAIVSPEHFYLTEHPSDVERTFFNSPTGIAALMATVKTIHPKVIAVESMGGDQWPLVRVLVEAMLPVIVVSPRQIRELRAASGLASTDNTPCMMPSALEGRILARFAETVRVTV